MNNNLNVDDKFNKLIQQKEKRREYMKTYMKKYNENPSNKHAYKPKTQILKNMTHTAKNRYIIKNETKKRYNKIQNAINIILDNGDDLDSIQLNQLIGIVKELHALRQTNT
jgi:phage-related baseplate assembly protein